MTNNDNQNSDTVKSAIPDDVLEALKSVRDSGKTNMLDRITVTHLTKRYGTDEAFIWLFENPKRFMEALIAMGERGE